MAEAIFNIWGARGPAPVIAGAATLAAGAALTIIIASAVRGG